MLFEDGLNDGFLCQLLARLGFVFAFGLVVVDVKAQDVTILNRVGNRVGVELLLEDVLCGLVKRLISLSLLIRGVLFKNWCTSEPKQLSIGEELFNCSMVLAKLGAVTLVENKHDPLITQWLQPFLIFALVCAIQCKAELLNCGDDHLITVVIGKEALHKGFGVGVFFDAVFLKAVEFLSRLPIKILAIHHE